jgi:hypothetical protein
MRFPVVRERVRVQGLEGTFLVLAVDRGHGFADLMPATKGGQILEKIPLSSILPLVDKEPGSPEKKSQPSK